MAQDPEPDVIARLDRSLLALRRFLDTPAASGDGARHVDLSTVLVADALATGGRAEVTIGFVARALGVTPSTASRLVDRAVAAGAVVRRPSTGNRRNAALALTPSGHALHESAAARRADRLRALLREWTPGEREAFAVLLARFAADAADAADGPIRPGARPGR